MKVREKRERGGEVRNEKGARDGEGKEEESGNVPRVVQEDSH